MSAHAALHNKLVILPYAEDPLDALAGRLLQDHHASLPRLDSVTLLLPSTTDPSRLRRRLLESAAERGHQALLGPQIIDWRSWLNRQPLTEYRTTGNYRRELILVEALRQHQALFAGANLWALADSLLTLFDELTMNSVELPADVESFVRTVAGAYGVKQGTLAALNHEAELVHTLWRAWHQELNDRDLIDSHTRTLLQLTQSLATPLEGPLYLLAPDTASRAEESWLAQLMTKEGVTLLLHGHHHGKPPRIYHPEYPLYRQLDLLEAEQTVRTGHDNYSRLLDTVFTVASPPLRERAQQFAAEVPGSPLQERLTIFSADSDEEEARAVELQVRRWLVAGQRHVGIVTENRRLARRVRALLERANIQLEDAAGWALSTTSAAALLERWLQCVEEDFPHRAMLDLLKSPFFCHDDERETHLEQVYRLEQDIILHENIGSGISRYLQHIAFRQQRLPAELAGSLDPVADLLQRLADAATALSGYTRGESCDALTLLEAVTHSLEQLGIFSRLEADEAGARLLEELQKMQQALGDESMSMSWLEFRGWLGRTLERYTFRPAVSGQVVKLMGLSQSRLARFDALIIAGAERESLPGTPATSPFFNDAVRRELGLPPGEQQLAERFYHFRRLLEAAPQVLLTHRRQNNGEDVIASPWLELLLSFHRLAYGSGLHDRQLEQLLQQSECEVVQRDRPLPAGATMPQPALPSALLPQRYSASAYQQLIDCPYQFFAARGLGLAPAETIREALEKSDYGERVHLCLQALHGGVSGLPGPYSGNWEPRRRDEAIELLRRISKAVFARDLEDNFLHRGWLQRWEEKIPAYIDWQLERAARWRVISVEERREQTQTGIQLHGRLDRIDSDGTELAIVDYKTGSSADQEEVLSGEAIQLPFYALLAAGDTKPVTQVEYLSLDQQPVASRSVLEGEELIELSQSVSQRLERLQQQMAEGASLPAWGDETTCGYCKLAGVCRKQAWAHNKKGD